MIKELKKTYELLPKVPDEDGRYLEVKEIAYEGYRLLLEINFTSRPSYRATYIVTHEELLSAKFDYEEYAIETICGIAKLDLVGEETENA